MMKQLDGDQLRKRFDEEGYVVIKGLLTPEEVTRYREELGRLSGLRLDTLGTDFLSGKKYFDVVPHGKYVGYEPDTKWIKPSIVLIGESNYSDAQHHPTMPRQR